MTYFTTLEKLPVVTTLDNNDNHSRVFGSNQSQLISLNRFFFMITMFSAVLTYNFWLCLCAKTIGVLSATILL